MNHAVSSLINQFLENLSRKNHLMKKTTYPQLTIKLTILCLKCQLEAQKITKLILKLLRNNLILF